jgi:LuxR family maltose regulon positive regulatory protein
VAGRVPLVEAKTTVPALPQPLVARPRLAERLAELVRTHRVVTVLATPGAGKTTAVVETSTRLQCPIAWLTLDDTETAPGRLLLYLEAAVRRAIPSTAALAAEALAAGVGHAETAAVLAEAMPDEPAIVVVDEVERLADAPSALAVLAGFVRYARPHVTVVLVGRRDVPLDVGSRLGLHEIARLDEHELAFSRREVEDALELRGLRNVDPSAVIEATGGWAAGVLFEAWRPEGSAERMMRDGDPLAGYLGRQILDSLDPEEREFLVVTSLLRDVDAHSARALGLQDADEMLARLADRYLPVTWTRKAVMRCHPRFREHLRDVLLRRDPADVVRLRTRYGLSLAAEGHDEEAVVELLAIDRVTEALEPAARALPSIIARQDVQLALDWLKRFDAVALGADPRLLSARLSLAITLEEFGRAVDAADRLRAPGYPPGGEERALAAWAYWHVGRLDDARAMLDEAPSEGAAEVVSYLFSLVDRDPPEVLPQPRGGPLDPLLLRIMYARGRLAEVRDAPVSDWMPEGRERISAYRALGELERTEEMLAAPPGVVYNLRSEGTVRAELMMDLGREAEARQALLRGRAKLVRSGSFVFDVISRLLAAKLELRMRGDAERALAILRGAEAAGPTRWYGHLAEQVDCWTGYALLLRGDDEGALERLRAALESMRAADRILELPTAGVYLAEAEWRVGSPDAADRAADIALEAAGRQGSRHLLFQALRDVPAVAVRRLDAEPAVDGPWHEVVRSLGIHHPRHTAAGGSRIRLRDFGSGLLLVDSVERRARIAKTYALLAYLMTRGEAVARDELLDALFDSRTDASARAYLRQAIHGLRQLLPADAPLLAQPSGIALSDPGCVEVDSLLLEARLESAGRLAGIQRFEAGARALELAGRGEFLAGVECTWVRERRSELSALMAEARIGMAVGAFEDSRFDLAEPVLERVLAEDPYRERAWRLLMRIAVARGADDEVIELYRRCEDALRVVGLEPAEATRLLVAGLRR